VTGDSDQLAIQETESAYVCLSIIAITDILYPTSLPQAKKRNRKPKYTRIWKINSISACSTHAVGGDMSAEATDLLVPEV